MAIDTLTLSAEGALGSLAQLDAARKVPAHTRYAAGMRDDGAYERSAARTFGGGVVQKLTAVTEASEVTDTAARIAYTIETVVDGRSSEVTWNNDGEKVQQTSSSYPAPMRLRPDGIGRYVKFMNELAPQAPRAKGAELSSAARGRIGRRALGAHLPLRLKRRSE